MNNRAEIDWAPRVNLYSIQRLYLSTASGLYDDLLIDDVGIALFLRCDSIMEYTHAHEGRVRCKRCVQSGIETTILRTSDSPNEVLRCPVCGWRIMWRVYVRETEKKSSGQLMACHARAAFETYLGSFPICTNAIERLLAIDRLIHEFHWSLKLHESKPTAMRTACVNLLEGTATQIMSTLNALTYNANTPANLIQTRDHWQSHAQRR